MLDVAFLKNDKLFSSFNLIAGEDGLHRNISNVVILDFEGIEENYYGFQEGDFVLTNLMFAKHHPEKIYNSFNALINLGVSAFAIKTVIYTELPDSVIELCNEAQVPLFTFKDIFIEDVILNINDHLRASANFNYYEELITPFTEQADHTSRVLELMDALNITDHNSYVSSAFLGYKASIDEFSMQRTLNKLLLQIKHLGSARNLRAIKYKNGILLLEIYDKLHLNNIETKDLMDNWKMCIKSLNLDMIQFHIGINDSVLPIMKLDIAITRSLYSYRRNLHQQESLTSYSDLGIYNFLYPLMDSTYSKEYVLDLIHKLNPKCTNISDFKKTNTFITLNECVKNDFDMDTAAKNLYQHSNTIRYRINKIKELLCIEDDLTFKFISAILADL